jgi:hypothetical protein
MDNFRLNGLGFFSVFFKRWMKISLNGMTKSLAMSTVLVVIAHAYMGICQHQNVAQVITIVFQDIFIWSVHTFNLKLYCKIFLEYPWSVNTMRTLIPTITPFSVNAQFKLLS